MMKTDGEARKRLEWRGGRMIDGVILYAMKGFKAAYRRGKWRKFLELILKTSAKL